ncbi:hypothetical protein [Thiorhodovibrio frisius]
MVWRKDQQAIAFLISAGADVRRISAGSTRGYR